MKIGIFGGTFDPPHIGHLILASEAQEQLALDQVLWVLTPFPPHKLDVKISPVQDRLTLVLLAIAGNTNFALSRVDIERKPPHYAVDTVNILKKNNLRDTFFYLMGADSLNDLLSWYEPNKFIEACDGIGVMKRQGETIDTTELERQLPGLAEKTYVLNTPIIEVAGSDIRQRVKSGKQFRYLVPEKVYHYILNHKLYRA